MMTENELKLITLAVDHIKKVPVANFAEASRNQAIRDKFLTLMGTEQFDVMAYNEHKYEIFQIVREVIQQTIANGEGAMSAFYNQFVEESFIEWGDKKSFDIDNDSYLTVGKISGNNWDLSRQRMDRGASFTVSTEAYYIKIYEYFKRFMTGRMDFADLVSAVDRTVKKFKDDFVAQVFASGVDGLPQAWFYVGSYNEPSIQTVLDNVTASNDGAEVTLTGTKSALNKLQGITVANLSDAQKAEYGSKGYLREWKGYVCAELPTLFKANSITEFCFDNNTIYVLPTGAKPVKIVNEGQVLVAETDDIADRKDMTKEFATIWNMGGAFIMNRLIGGMKLS